MNNEDLIKIMSLPQNLINTIFNEDKTNIVNRYIRNLIINSRLEFGPNKIDKIVPRNENLINYLSFNKSLRSDSMGCMINECYSAKMNKRGLILKTAGIKYKNKIVNDYLIGLHLNKLSLMTNIFNKYHGMFRCNSRRLDLWCNNNKIRPNELQYCIVSEAFSFAHYSSQLLPDINLNEYFIKNRNMSHDELCSILIQILCGIHFSQEQFEFMHNNLTALNIIIHCIKPTRINYKIKDYQLTIMTNVIPIIHNFHSSTVHKNIMSELVESLNSNIVKDPSNEFERAYWDNDKHKLIELLNALPIIREKHGSLDLYVDMIYGQNTDSIQIINLVDLAKDFGMTINDKPKHISSYDQTSDIMSLIYDLSKYAYVLSNVRAINLLKTLSQNKNSYTNVIEIINTILIS